MAHEKCERCGTIKAYICHNCGARLHPYYSGTLSGGGVAPWWRDDEDEMRCKADIPMDPCKGLLHYPTSQEPSDA